VPDEEHWQLLSRMVEVRSPWLSLIGERLRDQTGRELDYWRVERPDSLLVVTVHRGRLILPARSYRPGVGRATLDLAGGRLEDPGTIPEVARSIVRREFNLGPGEFVASQEQLNPSGWDVDSSTSSQRLYGVALELDPRAVVPDDTLGACYPATELGSRELLRELSCVQCRAVLGEWLAQAGKA